MDFDRSEWATIVNALYLLAMVDQAEGFNVKHGGGDCMIFQAEAVIALALAERIESELGL